MDQAQYDESEKEARQKPELAQRLRVDAETVRMRVEPVKKVTLSRDEAKRIIMEVTKMQGDADVKLSKIDLSKMSNNIKPQDMAQMLYAMEQTKIMDNIYLKYDSLCYPELMHAVKHYDLETDDDVVAL